MEILNSGSFVPLDNREKIEQLIFTARTLAAEVGRNEGFQSSGQTNQQIGLELWNGAEYMTRSHEEVTIRNIFLSKFLERLREVEREPAQCPPVAASPAMSSQESNSPCETAINSVTQIEPVSGKPEAPQDEFLGMVDSETSGDERPSYANECIPEFEDEIAGMIADDREADVSSVIASEIAIQPSEESSPDPEEGDSLSGNQQIKSVVLAEQEPYNFDSCTVTAVLQLLPEVNGVRDCILSVRSHDFAPQIVFSNIVGENSRLDLSARLTDALDQYRAALPGFAAEKLRKEKPSTKKRASKVADPAAKASETAMMENTDTNPIPNAVVQEQAKEQQNLFAS